MNQKRLEIAAPSKQHIAVGLEDTAFDQDAAVTEEASLTLLIELIQELRQVARHLHVYTSVSPAKKGRERQLKDVSV